MADRWFRLPEADPQSEDTRPAYISASADGEPKYDVDGWSGNTIGGSPIYIARVYADLSTLDSLAAESDVTELTDSNATDALNNASVGDLPSEDRTASEWNDSFKVGDT